MFHLVVKIKHAKNSSEKKLANIVCAHNFSFAAVDFSTWAFRWR